MKRINPGLAVALLTLAAASSIVLKSPNESADAQDVETGFRPLVAQMETLLQTHHFNRDALQGEHYDNTLAALYALAETAPDALQAIIDILVEATIDYLAAQVDAGAEVLQIFESWAASLQGAAFERWCLAPVAAIIAGLRARGISVPIIGFPRAADWHMGDYADRTQCQIIGLDTKADRKAVMAEVPADIVLQGNLDPQILVRGGDALRRAVGDILSDFADRKFIFNLGHGIVPQTPPEHVADLVAMVRGEKEV